MDKIAEKEVLEHIQNVGNLWLSVASSSRHRAVLEFKLSKPTQYKVTVKRTMLYEGECLTTAIEWYNAYTV